MGFFYTILESTIGSFMLTYGIIASNGNYFGLLIIFALSILITNKPTVFNPAVTVMELL